MGLFFNNEQSENGYTLFSNNEMTYLIDNCGFIVNEWESEYKTNNGLFITPSGDLYRQGKLPGTIGTGGAGGIIERFSWNGNLEWSYQIADDQFLVHHDMLLMLNGNIMVIVWQKISAAQAIEEGRTFPTEMYNEQIWEIKPLSNNQATIVWKWSALDHVIQDKNASKSNFGTVADHPELIDINYITSDLNTSSDWLHINAIDYNETYDQIIICSRNTSEVYVIDHSTTTAQAAGSSGGTYGKGGDILYRYGNPQAFDRGEESDRVLHQAHDVSWIKNGEYAQDFLIFNNKYLTNNRSRIQIWSNPAVDGHYTFSDQNLFGSDDMLWTYDAAGFYSSRMSSAQMMPNGNILATEGTTGEISEITPTKDKVWKYINPVNKNGGPGIQSGTPQFNTLFKASRYPDDYVGFDGKDLIPGVPVELSPDDIGCQIFLSTSTKDEKGISTPNYTVTNHSIIWKGELPHGNIYIFDVFGRLCVTSNLSINHNEIDISSLKPGTYILKSVQYAGSLFNKRY